MGSGWPHNLRGGVAHLGYMGNPKHEEMKRGRGGVGGSESGGKANWCEPAHESLHTKAIVTVTHTPTGRKPISDIILVLRPSPPG